MLIFVDASVLTADLALDHDACCGISGIFDAVYRGEHYAIGNRHTLTTLATNPNLSLVTKRTIATVLANLPTLGGIAARMSVQMRVTYGGETIFTKISPCEWEISLGELGRRGVKKSVLLTENLDDARAYEHAAKQYQVSVGLPGQVTLERAGGGGSTTPESFSNFSQNEKRWCLCISDSDRLHPTANMDITAQKCQKIAIDDSIVAVHVDLVVREIENILPIAFLAEVIPHTHQPQWDWHVNRLHRLRPDAHSYCDIKEGTTLRKVRLYAEGSPTRRYWELVASDLIKASALTSDCADDNECKQCDQEPCLCPIGHGFGDKVLELVVQNLDRRTPHQSEKMTRNDLNRQAWMDIGCKVYEWGCAPNKTRL